MMRWRSLSRLKFDVPLVSSIAQRQPVAITQRGPLPAYCVEKLSGKSKVDGACTVGFRSLVQTTLAEAELAGY